MTYYYEYNCAEMASAIVGATVQEIYLSQESMSWVTDRGVLEFHVIGDCCSESYFHDFYGVENLLRNGPITNFETISLSPGDVGYRSSTWEDGVGSDKYGDEVQAYGYRFTTEHPRFGPVSSVLSFRNSSNGYYGGSLTLQTEGVVQPSQVRVHSDITDVEKFIQGVIQGELVFKELES